MPGIGRLRFRYDIDFTIDNTRHLRAKTKATRANKLYYTTKEQQNNKVYKETLTYVKTLPIWEEASLHRPTSTLRSPSGSKHPEQPEKL